MNRNHHISISFHTSSHTNCFYLVREKDSNLAVLNFSRRYEEFAAFKNEMNQVTQVYFYIIGGLIELKVNMNHNLEWLSLLL